MTLREQAIEAICEHYTSTRTPHNPAILYHEGRGVIEYGSALNAEGGVWTVLLDLSEGLGSYGIGPGDLAEDGDLAGQTVESMAAACVDVMCRIDDTWAEVIGAEEGR